MNFRSPSTPWLTQSGKSCAFFALFFLLTLAFFPSLAFGQKSGKKGQAYFKESAGSTAYPTGEPKAGILETPFSSVEHFVVSSEQQKWKRAAQSLNFKFLEAVDAKKAGELARKFFYVLNQRLWIDWTVLPDRPDGLREGSIVTAKTPMVGKRRRAISLGTIHVEGRDVPVILERVKRVSEEPVWQFSAHTVETIPKFYELYGPTWLEENLPAWATERTVWSVQLWQWLGFVTLVLLSTIVAFIARTYIARLLRRLLPDAGNRLVADLRYPSSLFIASAVMYLGFENFLGFPGEVTTVFSPLIFGIMALALTAGLMRIANFFANDIALEVIRGHYDEESAEQKRLLTQITVARHVVLLIIAVAGISLLLMELNVLRTVSFALLTSAGAAAVILGIAGHAVLGNLISGLQIALTQPFRLGDSVIVEGNWGRIEQLTYTYVVVRTWDKRRIILPVSYFVKNVFENWSKTNSYMVKPIYLKLDYRANVEKIRRQFFEFLKADEDWEDETDGQSDSNVVVSLCDDETMTIRLTCPAATPTKAWYLHCRIRERMLSWLQEVDGGDYLPRQRVLLMNEVADVDLK